MAEAAVPVTRELSGEAIASGIQPDGTITLALDGLRLPLALPALAPGILRRIFEGKVPTVPEPADKTAPAPATTPH